MGRIAREVTARDRLQKEKRMAKGFFKTPRQIAEGG
jgi:hypothetical protein